MKNISSNYAEILHSKSLNPYSQYFYKKNGRLFWVINTLTKEARKNILLPLTDKKFDEFYIKYKSEKFVPKIISIEDVPYDDFSKEISNKKLHTNIKVEFLTATSFKSQGRYEFMPNIKFILNSLYNKFKLFYPAGDKEYLMDSLLDKAKIVDYELKSARFNLEGVKIPSFEGYVIIHFKRCDLKELEFAHAIFEFGKYCGIGIKTSIGMGGINTY